MILNNNGIFKGIDARTFKSIENKPLGWVTLKKDKKMAPLICLYSTLLMAVTWFASGKLCLSHGKSLWTVAHRLVNDFAWSFSNWSKWTFHQKWFFSFEITKRSMFINTFLGHLSVIMKSVSIQQKLRLIWPMKSLHSVASADCLYPLQPLWAMH